MRALPTLVAVVILSAATHAHAQWTAANADVEAAVRNPRISAVLEATARLDRAILERDQTAFSATFTDDAVVNNPFNLVARKADAERNMATGLIDYTSLTRSIEYAAVRGEHDVVLMGEETLTPVGEARFAGETIRRRITEIWTDESGEWKLAIRQATIFRQD